MLYTSDAELYGCFFHYTSRKRTGKNPPDADVD